MKGSAIPTLGPGAPEGSHPRSRPRPAGCSLTGFVDREETRVRASLRRRSQSAALMALLALPLGCGEEQVAPPPPAPGWIRHASNPILAPGPPGSWDAGGVSSPCVLRLDALTWAMWYAGRDSVRSQIGLATSLDGVRWTKHPDNPIFGPAAAPAWDSFEVGEPCVLLDDGVFRMYYSGRNGTSKSIGVATSVDGHEWTRSDANPILTASPPGTWDDLQVGAPWVLREGVGFRMWYGGRGSGVTDIAIGHATSTDGLFWTKNLAPILDPEALEAVTTAACVVRSGTSYRLWYTAYHETAGGGASPGVIDLAQSPDGIECTFTETALAPGPPGAWDARTLRSACVLAQGSSARMWYAAEAEDGTGAIGFALTP